MFDKTISTKLHVFVNVFKPLKTAYLYYID